MALYVSTGDVVLGNGAIDLYDDAEENDTAYLYWGRCGRVWRCISLLETVW